MSLLVYDCETTGIPKKGKPLSDKTQPRIVQLGAVLLNSEWEEINHFSFHIRPDGWASSAGARNAHGIPERRCELYGIRIKVALAALVDFARSAHEVASYNLEFDDAMIDIELRHAESKPVEWRRGGLARTCIMELAAQRFGDGTYLKLEEAHRRATGIPYEPKHKALLDARAAIRILKAIRKGPK